MEIGLRVPLRADVARPGDVVLPARLTARGRPPAARLRRLARAAPGGGGRRDRLRARRASTCAPCAPRTSRRCPSRAATRSSRCRPRRSSRPSARSPARPRKDETRPILTGILVSASGDELRMVATDSYRLSVKETRLESPLDGGFEANVPARALEELARVVQSVAADTIEIGVRSNQVVFQAGGDALSSRLIDGQFPNYRSAAARVLRARAARPGRGARRRRAPREPHGPEERAAAPVLHRGRAHRLGPDARRRRGVRAAARAVRRRTVRDRLQPGLPARRARERRRRATSCSS